MNKRKKFLPFSILSLAAIFALAALSGCVSLFELAPSARTPDAPPLWLGNPDLVYPSSQYVAAVGSGVDLAAAEKSALASLAGIFGQSVSGEVTVSSRYADRMANERIIASTSDSSITEKITTAVNMDTLIGASIKETWTDGKLVYAIAVMDKAETAVLYAKLVQANDSLIEELSQMKGLRGFEEYSRLRSIAETAEATEALINVLSVASPAQAAALRSARPSAESYRMRLSQAAAGISISVTVGGDRQGILSQAFADTFSQLGFRSSSTSQNAGYILMAELSFQEVDMSAQNPFLFSRAAVNAILLDAATGETQLTYAASAREGHNSLSEAENRAARSLASKVRQDFSASLDALLSGF